MATATLDPTAAQPPVFGFEVLFGYISFQNAEVDTPRRFLNFFQSFFQTFLGAFAAEPVRY